MTKIMGVEQTRVVTTYQCRNQKCKATDKDRGYNPPPPQQLSCHKCKGKGTMGVLSTAAIEG